MPDSRIHSFGRWISSHDWLEVFQERDINAQCTAFYRTLHAAIDLQFPLCKAKILSNDRDWITPKVKLLIKKRQKAFHKTEREKWKRLWNRVIQRYKSEAACSKSADKNSQDKTKKIFVKWWNLLWTPFRQLLYMCKLKCIKCVSLFILETSVSALRQVAILKSQHVPSMNVLLSYLDVSPNQEYIIQRYRGIA